MMPARSTAVLFALAASAALLAGCNRQNHSLQIGQQVDLEVFHPSEPVAVAEASKPSGVLASTSTEVGQRTWTETEILVPNDGVYHRPLYKTEYSRVKYTARNRGEFPTAETALDLQDPRATGKQIAETFVFTPGVLIYDTVTAPFRMAIHPATQSNVKVSPRLPRPGYQRWMPGDAAATADPAAPVETTSTTVTSDGKTTTTTTTTTTTVTTTTKTVEKTESVKPAASGK